MAAIIPIERDQWTSILEKEFAPSECGLHLGEMHETDWHTISAELLDDQNNVFMIAEIDEDTRTVIRCRRPSAAFNGRH